MNEKLNGTKKQALPLVKIRNSLQIMKSEKEINYLKIDLIKTQIQNNTDFIARLKSENENLISDVIKLQDKIQELSEYIDYAFFS